MQNALEKKAQSLFSKNFDLMAKSLQNPLISKPISEPIQTGKHVDPGLVDSLDEFIIPVLEDQIKVGERSWCPEDDSHNAFKTLIIESFENEKFKTLTHVSHDLARKCINWFGTPGGKTYTVIILILRKKDYIYNKRFNEVWGSYAEY